MAATPTPSSIPTEGAAPANVPKDALREAQQLVGECQQIESDGEHDHFRHERERAELFRDIRERMAHQRAGKVADA